MDDKMGEEYVLKRDGRKELVDLAKITQRLKVLKTRVENFTGEMLHINISKISRRTISRMFNGISTSELDLFAAETSAYITDHPDYQTFAGNIVVSNLESNNRFTFDECVAFAYQSYESIDSSGEQKHSPLVSRDLYDLSIKYKSEINAKIVADRNMLFDYFAIQTLINGKYLLFHYKDQQVVTFEHPQYMWMRIALGLNGDNLEQAFEFYDLLSQKEGIMGTPTLFAAGTPKPQLSSCFILTMKDDSIEGIYDTLKQTALISKRAGGVGLAVHNVRCAGSHIASTNGTSNGLVPMLRVFSTTSQYVDQGGGRRKGSFAIYISPEHADIFEWLDLKKNSGAEELRARELFYGLWISDLFMKRIIEEYQREKDTSSPVMWSLFDPNVAVGLHELWGEEFEREYIRLENLKRYVRQVPIRELWTHMLTTMIETGTPYILFKDSCNRKSNHQNLGTIKSSNLCTEILEYTSAQEVAVCNLGTVSLPSCMRKDRTFDFQKLYRITRTMIRNLDLVIDINCYPVEEAKTSNYNNRPVGLGIQGYATLFTLMRIGFTSPTARKLNRQIAETMYFAALTESHDLAVKKGCYPSIDKNGGAPIRRGIFQQDMWENANAPDSELNWAWEPLRAQIMKDGVHNSLLICHPPSASTSQILGNSEMFEPWYAMMFARKTKSGEFFVLNAELVKELTKLGLWNIVIDPITQQETNPMRDELIRHGGSIQKIDGIPNDIKEIFKTIWEVKLGDLTDMAVDRSQYIDQSSSLNVHFHNTTNMIVPLTKYLTYAWRKGLKTGSYYLRTLQENMALTAHSAVTAESLKSEKPKEDECTSCSG